MLKTQPRFRLDWKYKGPFIVKSVTPTNVVIQLQDNSTAEELYVSRQRVSLCSSEMSHSMPWVGHSKKMRKRRTLRQRTDSGNTSNNASVTEAVTTDDQTRVSSRGRQIRTPARFRLVDSPKAIQKKRGEVVETDHHVSDDHVKGVPQERR